jgi:UDP-N-acetylmuramyl pentapeptide phosphotransferase/UDP-N-acetylglucosamine-1-phosphate transferase
MTSALVACTFALVCAGLVPIVIWVLIWLAAMDETGARSSKAPAGLVWAAGFIMIAAVFVGYYAMRSTPTETRVRVFNVCPPEVRPERGP